MADYHAFSLDIFKVFESTLNKMALYSKYLQMIPKISFTAIYLSNQIYGEVDPSFVRDYDPMLLETWKFIDYKDTLHTVTFNMSFLVLCILLAGEK
ncbi:hypothetical protein P8452_57986 [Trifolium repens]|nr:hypothetical protein P8452_57986 [Trifolium repens]